MFYLDLETPKVSHKRTLPLRQINNNTSKETISPPRQAWSAKKNLQNQNDSLSFCFSRHRGLSLLLSTKPGTKLNYLEALKAFKGYIFFTFLSGNCFCRPFRLWVEGRRLWRCHILQQRWGMMFKQEEKSRLKHDFFQAPCWLLWLWRRPWLQQPRQWGRWVRHDTLLPNYWWGSYYKNILWKHPFHL